MSQYSDGLNDTESANRKPRQLQKYLSDDYDKLPKQRHTIRLLNLLSSSSDNPQIECELITPKGDETKRKPYYALSWCWGKEKPSQYVSIRKGRKKYAKYVQPNLFAALHALRHHQNDRFLWIDAICINQEDLDEKNHQVEMMHEIFGNAECVCIWLGEASKSSRTALRFIKDEVLKLQNFDELCENATSTPKWRALLELMQREWFSRRWVVQEVALAKRALIYCGTDKISWDKFAIAVELFVEVETATHRLSEVMQKTSEYYPVPGLFEYVSQLGASLLVDATGRLFRDDQKEPILDDAEREDRSDLDSDDGSASDTDVPENPSFTNCSNGQHIGATVPSARSHPLLGLEYLVSSLYGFNTTVPHDTIYALLAISKDSTPIAADGSSRHSSDHAQDALEVFTQRKRYNVDYKLSYVDVCKEFIQFCIERWLQIDRSRALDVILRPWATEQSVLDDVRRQEERAERATMERKRKKMRSQKSTSMIMGGNLPINSDSINQQHHGGSQDSRTDVTVQSWNGSAQSSHNVTQADPEDMKLPSWIPQLSGAPFAMYQQPGIDAIKMGRKNADPLVGMPSMTQRNYSAPDTKRIDMKTLKFRKRVELEHFSMYIRGFVFDEIEASTEPARTGQIPKEWATFGGWRDAEGNPPDQFWRTLVADRGRDGKNPPVYYSRACKECFRKGGFEGGAVDTKNLINYERNSVVAEFCRRVQAVTWNRTLIRTKKTELLGLAAEYVQPEDLVCILYGCSVPVILRRGEKKSDEVFEKEMEWELDFLRQTMVKYYKQYRDRVAAHKSRVEELKKEFLSWERQKRKQWLKDKDWRQFWQRKLVEEAQREEQAGKRTRRQYEIGDLDNLEPKREIFLRKLRLKLVNALLRVGRDFNAWKRAKGKQAKHDGTTDWRPLYKGGPLVNWRKFELRLKYGRRWKKIVQRKKKELLRTAIEFKRHNGTGLDQRRPIVSEWPYPTNVTDSDAFSDARPSPEGLTSIGSPRAVATLSEEEMEVFDHAVRENFRKRAGEDGYYSYLLLGEAYIHGMMDGEAMAHQNKKQISTTVFEIR